MRVDACASVQGTSERVGYSSHAKAAFGLRRAIAQLRTFTALAVALAFFVLIVALFWLFQRNLVYFPDARPVQSASAVLAGAQDVSIETDDGIVLGGWWVPARVAGDGTAVVFFNGNAGNRSDRAPLAEALSRSGLHVLLFDYRGYARNAGAPTEAGLLRDARAAVAHAAARPGVDPARIVYFGESLGSSVAVQLAKQRPPLALVLRSPFTSLADVGRHHYPWLPVHPLLLSDRYASLDAIGDVRAPLLVIVGERDEIVPASHSRRLHEAAPGTKRIVVVPGARHNDPVMLSGDEVVREVLSFIRAMLVP